MQASKEAIARGKKLNMLSLVVWSSIVPPLPMLLVTLILDKPATVLYALINLKALSVFSILYLALISTVIAYGIWGTLIAKYPAGKVAPLSILVPVIGLITAQIVLEEYLSVVQWLGAAIVILGLLISNFFGYLRNSKIDKN
ncbi:EamA family transporter [Aminipila sp.]|uniref:EamA family transporter n=1 Tax=Aminipila sp. TaxID=2060095 RepID=UPI00289EB3FF|nr:EamA family transporter [Aminipila sp.]